MFETPKEVQPDASSSKTMFVVAAVLVIILAAGAYFYFSSTGAASKNAAQTPTAAAPSKPADPVHDLKIQAATMNKDATGTTAVWLVTIENRSTELTYSKIEYETTYVGADNNALLVNKGTFKEALGPNDRRNLEIRDALYPSGTAWYKFRILGASSAVTPQ